MYNPLTPDLSELSIDELTKRLSKLNARMAEALQFGRVEVANQVRVMITETSEELSKRSRDLLKKPEDEDKTKNRRDPNNLDPLNVGEND